MKTGRSNNQGFSLVELIVVLAIMAIVIGVAGISVASLSGRKLGKCADEMTSAIESARVMTLGKEQNAVECVIYKESDGSYHTKTLQGGVEIAHREIGEEPITIRAYFDNESAGYDLDSVVGDGTKAGAEAGLHIMFNRASGAFIESTNVVGGTTKKYCTKLEVKSGSKQINIALVGKTGKVVKN